MCWQFLQLEWSICYRVLGIVPILCFFFLPLIFRRSWRWSTTCSRSRQTWRRSSGRSCTVHRRSSSASVAPFSCWRTSSRRCCSSGMTCCMHTCLCLLYWRTGNCAVFCWLPPFTFQVVRFTKSFELLSPKCSADAESRFAFNLTWAPHHGNIFQFSPVN